MAPVSLSPELAAAVMTETTEGVNVVSRAASNAKQCEEELIIIS